MATIWSGCPMAAWSGCRTLKTTFAATAAWRCSVRGANGKWPMQAGDLQRLQALCPQVAQLPLEIPAAASSSVRHHPNPELVPSELLTDLAQRNLYGFSIDDLPCADRTDPIQPAGR